MNSPCATSSWRDLRSFLGKQLMGAQAILPARFGPSVLWLKRIEAVKGAANDKGNYIDFGSVWAKDRASQANRAIVTLGFRFDNRSIFGSAIFPKAGLNHRVTVYWRIRASYGRGFRPPDLGLLFLSLPQSNRVLSSQRQPESAARIRAFSPGRGRVHFPQSPRSGRKLIKLGVR
jgi:outer membrane receptor protein involved in Fe transport